MNDVDSSSTTDCGSEGFGLEGEGSGWSRGVSVYFEARGADHENEQAGHVTGESGLVVSGVAFSPFEVALQPRHKYNASVYQTEDEGEARYKMNDWQSGHRTCEHSVEVYVGDQGQ